jgi:ribose transport system substrate-binding protein
MGEEAVKLLNGKGTVALMTSIGATNLQRRLDGVLEALAKAPGIRVIETFDVKEDTVKAAELIATGTNRYPDLGAWISVGGWPVFTRNALVPVPKSTLVISFDTIQPAPELLKAGKVQILIGQKYFGWGEEPVKMLAGIKAGRMPATTIIDAGVDVVRADNVDAYIAEFKRLEAGK